ncbi:thioredoxin 3 [Hepatocystis sp. ex Piliocolobus tephrosceles]|nr:thioredoxin 3 [Hepatocystis sp. ex Piliocolobus tephrosceles]
MALICIGSICFSVFQVVVLLLLCINFFYSHIKKFIPQRFLKNNDIKRQITNILESKKKNKQESQYIKLPQKKTLKDIFDLTETQSIVCKFGSTRCKPCNAIHEYFKNQKSIYVVTLVDIDVDIHESLAKEYNIRALPTFEFYFLLNNEWVMAERIEGANKNEIEKAFQSYSLLKEN